MRPKMRRNNVVELPMRQAVESPPIQSMDLWVTMSGAQVAAWLVRKHRHQIHKTGALRFHIPINVETPPWFRVGWETLKRSSHWEVDQYEERPRSVVYMPRRIYMARWKPWDHYSRIGRVLRLISPSGVPL